MKQTFFTVKIHSDRATFHAERKDSIATFTVQAKTHRGALIAATLYQADDFMLHCVGADGSKWYITPTGRVAVVTKGS